MRLFKLFSVLAIILTVSYTSSFSQEEPPSLQQRLGLGASLRGTPLVSGDLLLGGHVVFTLSDDLHIGSQVGFVYDGGTNILDAATYIVFAPYIKYLLKPVKSFQPFGMFQFNVSSVPERKFNQITGKEEVKGVTNTSAQISFGGEWFIPRTRSMGIFGGFNFLQYNIDPSRFVIGLGNPFLGIEWFFD